MKLKILKPVELYLITLVNPYQVLIIHDAYKLMSICRLTKEQAIEQANHNHIQQLIHWPVSYN